ncbi:MAG: PepSY-associated TM helix domain-containing protein, partial [Bacteroidota bacterium]
MPTLLKQVVRHQRNWYGQWHTWAGIFAGSILLIVSLTGALLVFEQELDVWLNPQMFQFEESGERLSFEEVIQAVQAQHPDYSLNGVFVDPTRNDVYLMAIEREPEKYEQLYANHHTGAVTGIRVYQESVMGFIRHLHRTLLIPPFGKYLVGIAAIICAILMITGLRLWIPKRWNSLKARLGVKWGGSAKRVNYDFHNSLGFYFSPMITLISLTGAMITFAQVVLLFLFLLNFQSPMSISEVLDQ